MNSCETDFQIFVEDVQLCLDFAIREEESFSSASSPELYLKTIAPQFNQLKECRVYVHNLKSMTKEDLKRLGVFNLKRMLRKYEKREKHDISSGETEIKLRNSSSELSFSSRNGSGHKSSHRSALHNSVSWKNKFSGSDFDVFTYKVNRCKVKNCKLKKCIGYHGSYDRRRDPKVIVYKPTLCNNTSSGSSSKCPSGDSCPLSHSIYEVRYHPKVYKMYNCKKFKEGYCEKGDFCENLHESSAKPLQAKPKKTVSKSEKVVSKVNVGTVDFASSSSMHLDNCRDSKYRKVLSQEIPVMHSNTTSSIDIIPKQECRQNSFKEVSSIKPKLSYSNISSVEGSAYLGVSCKREKICHCYTDDLFLRCFKTLLFMKDFLSELGEWVSDLYCKVSSSEWKNVCMGEYLATRENCNRLYKIHRLLSSDTNEKIGVDNSKIKDSRRLLKILYSKVYSIRSKRLYLGLDLNSLAEQTLGQTYNDIFKNVRNILTAVGKPKVENIVIDNICKKIIDKQSKLKVSQCKNHQNSSNKIICSSKDPVDKFDKNQSVDKKKDTAVNSSGHVGNTMELLASRKIYDNSGLPDDNCKEISHRYTSPDVQNYEWDRKMPPESISKPPIGNLVNLDGSARILSTQYSEGPVEKCEGLKKVTSVMGTTENAPSNQQIFDMMGSTELSSVSVKKSPAGMVSLSSKEADLKCTSAKSGVNHVQSNTCFLKSGQDEDLQQLRIPCASQASFDTNGLPSGSVKTSESNLGVLLTLLPENYRKADILRSQSCKLPTENVSDTALKLPSSNELSFCDNAKLSRNLKIREAIDDKTVCGVPIQNMIDKLVSITLDLTYTQIFENVENFLKYTDPNIDRKIVNYICREVCNKNIKQHKGEKFQEQNYQDNKRDIGISSSNTDVSNKKEVFQHSFEDISDVKVSQTDLNIPLCFPLSKNEVSNGEVTNGKEGQSSFSPNPITKPLISEEDLLRGMEWEAPEDSECNLPKRKKVFSICVPDSPDCEIIESPNPYQKISKKDPDLVVLSNSPVIEHKEIYCSLEKDRLNGKFSSRLKLDSSKVRYTHSTSNFSQEKDRLNGKFSSRLKEDSSKIRYPHPHSTSVSKRKGTICLDNVTEVKKSRPDKTFETCIIIPSSPEDNFD